MRWIVLFFPVLSLVVAQAAQATNLITATTGFIVEPKLRGATNLTVTCRLKAYRDRGFDYPAEKLAIAGTNELARLAMQVNGFVLEICKPEALKGKVIRIHHDGPFGDSGDPLGIFKPGKLYEFIAWSSEIDAPDFWRCSVGWPRKVTADEKSK